MKRPIAAATLAVLAASAGAQAYDEADFVPVEDMARIFAERPFECAEYRPATEDCTALSIYTDRGGGAWSTMSLFLLDIAPSPAFAGRMDLRADAGRLCGDLSEVELASPELPEDMVAEIEGLMREALGEYGRVCMSFYALGGGDYMTVLRDEDGQILPDGEVEVTFVAEERNLYYVEETDL